MIRNFHPGSIVLSAVLVCHSAHVCAKDDIEFVAEHLPEVAMDNRYSTLPIWNLGAGTETSRYQLQGAYTSASAGHLKVDGPLLAISIDQALGPSGSWGVVGFYDSLQLSGNRESRPLQTLFAPNTPIERPVSATFSNLDGTAVDFGAGLFFSRRNDHGFLGRHGWTAGVLWQRVELRDYRFDYVVETGAQEGVRGQIDFDTHYDHIAPFAGIEFPRSLGDWTITPHALIAYPLPSRGVAGHITGPGFDITGDTASVGAGKHFGDPSVTLGLTLTYVPARLSVDFGTLVSQALLERRIHRGVDRNLVLSFCWSP